MKNIFLVIFGWLFLCQITFAQYTIVVDDVVHQRIQENVSSLSTSSMYEIITPIIGEYVYINEFTGYGKILSVDVCAEPYMNAIKYTFKIEISCQNQVLGALHNRFYRILSFIIKDDVIVDQNNDVVYSFFDMYAPYTQKFFSLTEQQRRLNTSRFSN